MIDIQKAKQELEKYVRNYDINDKKIKLKIAHIERTANIAKEIAISLNLDKEDIELAELIGLLHDIGRFEQVKQYNTFVDKNSVDHGKLGVKVLFEDGLIRNIIKNDKYDKVIKNAILNHNRCFENIEVSNEKELLHTKIIRDADKTDIIYILTFDEKEAIWEKSDLSNEIITDEIYREFIEEKQINYKERKTSADILVSHFAYVFDFNYKYGLKIIKEKQYFDKIFKRFNFKEKQTAERIENIYKIVKEYLKKQ